jgi:hypothetical protein
MIALAATTDHLAAALRFAARGGRFLNDSERARFFAVARRYQTLVIAEGKRFVQHMPSGRRRRR